MRVQPYIVRTGVCFFFFTVRLFLCTMNKTQVPLNSGCNSNSAIFGTTQVIFAKNRIFFVKKGVFFAETGPFFINFSAFGANNSGFRKEITRKQSNKCTKNLTVYNYDRSKFLSLLDSWQVWKILHKQYDKCVKLNPMIPKTPFLLRLRWPDGLS